MVKKSKKGKMANDELKMSKQAMKLTNEVGAPVAENENSLTAGPRGPVVMQDVWLLEKLAHFDREVIPERRMHAKGWGAYGNLTINKLSACKKVRRPICLFVSPQ